MKKQFFILFIIFALATPVYAGFSEIWEKTKNTADDLNPFSDSQKKMSKTLGNSNLDDPIAFNRFKKLIQDGENKIKNPGLLSNSDKEREKLKRDLNTADNRGFYPILFPIWQHDYQLTEKMLKYGANPNVVIQDINTPLTIAIERQDISIVRLLIEYGADCNRPLSNNIIKNKTPFLWACVYDNIEIINYIFSKTNNYDTEYKEINENREKTWTPLSNLIIRSLNEKTDIYNPIINNLIDKGVNINAKIDDLSLLQYLCVNYDKDKLKIIEKLAEKGADCGSTFQRLNGQNETITSTPLFEAVLDNDYNLIKILIEHLNKSQLENEYSVRINHGTVLSYISYVYSNNPNYYWPIIEELVKRGANLNAFHIGENRKTTAFSSFLLSFDEKQPTPLDKVEFLLKMGADPNVINTFVDENNNPYSYTAVHYAAGTNNKALLYLLEKYGGNLKLEDSDGKTALFYLSKHIENDADRLDFTYKNSMSIDDFKNSKPKWEAKTKSGLTLLQIAISNNDDDLAQYILDNKLVEWKQVDDQGDNALSYAFKYNRTKIIDYFIDNKIKIGNSIFFVIDSAIEEGNIDFLSRFLTYQDFKNISKKFGDNRTPVDPIVYAALTKQNIEGLSKNRNNVLDILLENKGKFTPTGLNSKITDDGQYPVLIPNDEDIIVKLLDYGANYNLTDNNKKNAIDYAFEKNQTFVIDWLLEHRAKIGQSLFYAIDNELEGHDSHIADFISFDEKIKSANLIKKIKVNGQTIQCGPVVYSTMVKDEDSLSQKRIRILEELISSGFNPNEIVSGGDFSGNSALLFAAMRNNTDVAKFLIENNADINIKNKGKDAGRTALFYAIENKNFNLANLIIQKAGSNLQDIQLMNQQDKKATLLMFVARYGDFNFAQAIVPVIVKQKKTALESRDAEGWTPILYAAAYNSDVAVLKVFRAYGSNMNAESKEKENARVLAEKYNNTDEVKTKLEDYGVFKE